MKSLDKYRLNKRLIEFGKLSWDLLVIFCSITLVLFVFISLMVFWVYIATVLYEQGADITDKVDKMIKIITIALGIVVINYIKNLRIK